MIYGTGEPVKVGDAVELHGMAGTVVFSIDTDEYSEDFSRAHWSYLGEGVGVLTDTAGLIHVLSNHDLALVRRAGG